MALPDRTLRLDVIADKIQKKGLNNQKISELLDITKQAVSDWFNGKKLPSPSHLLGLARILEIELSDLVSLNTPEPVVAFRKAGRTVKKDHHFDNAQNMGRLLKRLVPFLPGTPTKPPVLLSPRTDKKSIRNYANTIRTELGLNPQDTISKKDIIGLFHAYKAILIPVPWGKQKEHDNALHVYLPDSMTTWVYLNLDTSENDFLFWMAHEFAHLYSTELIAGDTDVSEKFADQFAAELLFPIEQAESLYTKISSYKNEGKIVNAIKEEARKRKISPVTIYLQLKAYASEKKLSVIEISAIYGAAKKLNEEFPSVSSLLKLTNTTSPKKFIAILESEFNTPFFKVVKDYIQTDKSINEKYLSIIMNINLIEAKTILEYLKNASN